MPILITMEKETPEKKNTKPRAPRKKILFVCTGNTCRSPIAQAVFKREIKQRKIKYYSVSSAGFSAAAGGQLSAGAEYILTKYGEKLNNFKSRRLTEKMVKSSYAVICMNNKMKAALKGFGNVYSFEDFIGEDVPDPYGYGKDAYEYVYKLICYAAPLILDKIIVD